MIQIKEAKSAKEMKQFVDLPFEVYKNNPYWVPTLKKDELACFEPDNAIFRTVEAKFFLAYKNNEIVGRIVSIINWTEVKDLGKPKIRFGWLIFKDDINILKALLTTVENIGKEKQLTYIEGPMGFSNMDKAGMLTDGFDKIATLIGLYNPEYYPNYIQRLGYKPEAEWLEYSIELSNLGKVQQMDKLCEMLKKRYEIDTYHFASIKEMLPYVDEMFDLLNVTYAELQSFVPIEKFQVEHYKKKYLKFIHPDFISCVKDKNGKMIAFAVTMPSFSKAFQKTNGKLLPFGWWHLMQAQKKNDHVEFYLIGIDPHYQNKGVNALIFKELYDRFTARGIKTLETNPLLEENLKIQQLWKNFEPVIHKRRKTFSKPL
ncbi:GNAT family N-acetyltransferase [Empedobacter sedimenti]|uniref:GNAT family N-acetyltransferase n=1 Tax=Empedobacter sedimenti TaxID=3042610 RepID=UPI0024A638EA|nr:GNAT family N-acetyltransferase [Empedobacter sedimenti]